MPDTICTPGNNDLTGAGPAVEEDAAAMISHLENCIPRLNVKQSSRFSDTFCIRKSSTEVGGRSMMCKKRLLESYIFAA